MQRLQKLIFTKARITSRHADDSHDVHGNKDRVDADESEPEVNAAQSLVHEASEHLRQPEVDCGKHSEYGCNTHYQVEVRSDDVGVVHRQIERALAEYQTRDTASDEE